MEGISFDRIAQRAGDVARLNTRVIAEIARDPRALKEAAIIVVGVAISAGIGNADAGANGLIGGIIASLLGWVIGAALVYFVGTRITATPTTSGSVETVLRSLGYAASPNLLSFIGIIPILGGLVLAILGLWTLITTILAIRASLTISLGRAVLTGIIALIGATIIQWLVGWIFDISVYYPF